MESANILLSLEKLYLTMGYPLVFFGSFIEVTPIAWFFPVGIFVVAGGFYSYSGGLSLLGILVSGILGEWLAFLLTYFLGFKGTGLVKLLKQERNAEKAGLLLKRHGAIILSTSMMAGLTRFWVSYVAGQQKYSFKKFLFYSGGASIAWTALVTAVGYMMGAKRENIENLIKSLGLFGWLLLALAIGIIFLKARKESRGEEEVS